MFVLFWCKHCVLKALFFLILGLQIFFQNIKDGGGKKIKITKKNFLFNLKHIWIGGKKITKSIWFYTVKMQKWQYFNFFFFNLTVFYNGGNKKSQKLNLIFFF